LVSSREFILQPAKGYKAKIVHDPFQAVGSMQRLRFPRRTGGGVHLFLRIGRPLAATLHLLLRNRALALPDDEELLDELANVRLRETAPGVLRMDHDPDRHDDRAIALALAAHSLLERQPVGRVGLGPVVV
jgi:hypothetical protein